MGTQASAAFTEAMNLEPGSDGDKGLYYKDTAIIRFSDPNNSVKVVKDTEFINEFKRRANNDFWKGVNCI